LSYTDDFIRAVESFTGRGGQRRGKETRLLCPGHDDHDPSLDVREGDDGSPLVQCRSHQCSFEKICDAIGRSPSEFLPPLAVGEDIVAAYDYVDEEGALLFQVVRRSRKRFGQRRPDGNGGWIWKLDGTRRVPYRLPRVLEAAAAASVSISPKARRMFTRSRRPVSSRPARAARGSGATSTQCFCAAPGRW